MKTKIMITVIAMIFFGTIAAGYGRTTTKKSQTCSPKAIQKTAIKSIVYPEFGYKEDLNDVVEITFTVSAEGKIEIKKISSGSDKLNNYVKEQISKVTIKDNCYPLNQLYSQKIAFQPG
jgi:hypothetical protein